MKTSNRAVAASLALLACSAVVVASAQQTRFVSSATGVRVDVLVLQGNAPVAGLQSADFELRDNGVVQQVDAVESQDVPISAMLALDTSGSTDGARLSDLQNAGRTLIAGLRPQDRGGLTTFSDDVRPRVPFTSDRSLLSAAVERVRPSGATSVLDGVYTAIVSTLAEPGRSLVVVCTDGRDTASWMQAGEVAEVAKRSNAVIYAVTAGTARGNGDLGELADITGGHVIAVEKGSDYQARLRAILEEFRSRYVISFTPTGVTAGGFHRLDVKVRRNGVTVRARQGYISAR